MKNGILILMLFGATSCLTMFDSKKDVMGKFKLKDGDMIEVINSRNGATAPDVIWISKISKKREKVLVDSMMIGGGLDYTVSFQQMDDTLLRIILIDAAELMGQKKERLVNLKNRIK